MVMIGAAAVEGVIQAEGHLVVWGRVVLWRVDACRLERFMVSMSAYQNLNISSADFKSPLRMVSHACGLQRSRGGGMAGSNFTSLCAKRGCCYLWCKVQGALPRKRTVSTADSAMPGQRPNWNLHRKANSKMRACLAPRILQVADALSRREQGRHTSQGKRMSQEQGKALVHRVVSTY